MTRMKQYVCLELGGTNLRCGLVAEDFTLRDFRKIPSAGLAEAPDKAEYLRRLLQEGVDAAGRENVLAVSMALSSLMDKERTTVFSSPMVKGFDNIPLAPILSSSLGLPVFMEKDVNILLLYELGRLPKPVDGISVGVFIGTGLGNAMCIDGRVYKGHTGAACELGHIPVPGLDAWCDCGKKGCIELLACGRILNRLASEKYRCHVSRIFAEHGEEEDVRSVVRYCAIAIATEVTLLDPARVILGGGVPAMPNFPLDYLVATVRENLRCPDPRDSFAFIPASADEQAGVVGAAINASQLLGRREPLPFPQ